MLNENAGRISAVGRAKDFRGSGGVRGRAKPVTAPAAVLVWRCPHGCRGASTVSVVYRDGVQTRRCDTCRRLMRRVAA